MAISPFQAQAGFFSSLVGNLVGNDAYAQTGVTDSATPTISKNNSQTMALLQANTSALPIQNTKDSKKDNKDNQVDTSANVSILSDNALMPATSAMGVSGGTNVADSSADQTSVYVVRKGDSLSAIADMFGVSVNTILWANDMKKGDKLAEGDVLFILPISGVEHTVAKGQTLQTIAKLYKADVSDIASYNGIAQDAKLAVGDKLMIPDAIKAEENDKPIKNLAASIEKDKQYYLNHPLKNLLEYFVNPVPGYRKSQGIHDNNGVDLAIARGTPIHASAAGTVTLARSGYNGGFGYLVIISHPNGTETLYAHQSKITTHTGDQVSQGEVIGYVGSTGHSTGPHLHFEVHGARNPGADSSWAN